MELTEANLEAMLLSIATEAAARRKVKHGTITIEVWPWVPAYLDGLESIEQKFSGSNWRRRKREYRKLHLSIKRGLR